MHRFLFLFILFAGWSACYYEVEEELVDREPCSTESISYSNDVLPILENRCFECHGTDSNQGNITLEGYSRIKVYADNGKLIGVIRHDAGFPPMPQNEDMLPACDIEKIMTWVGDGAPNN